MIEIIPNVVNSAFLYFHTRGSTGDEITPFLNEIQMELPKTYIWAGDGCIGGTTGNPALGKGAKYGKDSQRYWFVFPMQDTSKEEYFTSNTEAMGAILITCGGYVNSFVDRVISQYNITSSNIVLCGHQHGACVALAAAMMRRENPFALTLLFDPWPWEAFYLQYEKNLPKTEVICIDNLWVRERERNRCADVELYRVFRNYGINANGITLPEGRDQPDKHMFLEAVRQIKNKYY